MASAYLTRHRKMPCVTGRENSIISSGGRLWEGALKGEQAPWPVTPPPRLPLFGVVRQVYICRNLHGAHAAAHYPNTRFLVVTRSAPTTPGPPREDLRERAGVSLGLRPRDVVPLRATPHGRGSDQSRAQGASPCKQAGLR